MPRYLAWLKALPGKPVFVAYPAVFDFSFVYWYLTQYAGEDPFGYSAIDIKPYAMAMRCKPYRACGKQSTPPEWFDSVVHTLVALDDAIEQDSLFCNRLCANLDRVEPLSAPDLLINEESLLWSGGLSFTCSQRSS